MMDSTLTSQAIHLFKGLRQQLHIKLKLKIKYNLEHHHPMACIVLSHYLPVSKI
jgi:hypothetical protein